MANGNDLREAFDLMLGRAEGVQPLPAPTAAEGPDPYGDPDPEWLRIDWRPHLRTLELERTIHYVDIGPTETDSGAPTILLVHGLSGSWQTWLENIPELARNRRVVALDLPGFGRSPLVTGPLTVQFLAATLLEFCERAEIGECDLVGHSMGGFASAEAAIEARGRFRKLVLVSAAGVTSSQVRAEPATIAGRLMAATAPSVFRLQKGTLRRPRLRHLAFITVYAHPELLRRELLYEQAVVTVRPPGFLPAVAGLFGYHMLDRLAEVETPSLIVWGRDDRIVPSGDSLVYAERLANSRAVIFDDTGHCPHLERPVRFNRVLGSFLADG